jgi:hypothetical protein
MGGYGSFQSFHPFLLSLAKFKRIWMFHMKKQAQILVKIVGTIFLKYS